MTKIHRAVLLAAGRGTRMRELTADLPKPMIEVRGKPVLQHIVEGLRDAGVRKFLIIVGYRADAPYYRYRDNRCRRHRDRDDWRCRKHHHRHHCDRDDYRR